MEARCPGEGKLNPVLVQALIRYWRIDVEFFLKTHNLRGFTGSSVNGKPC